jgi:hypothetical protein
LRPVSSEFLATIRGSHRAVFKAVVLDTFQTGVSPTGVEIPIISGDVTSSAKADIRSTLNLTTDTPWPRKTSDLLMPYGNEIAVSRGVAFGNGRREWVQLGIFRINTPAQTDVPDGTITIDAEDRMSGIIDAEFIYPRQFPAAMLRGALVALLIGEVYPSAVVEWDDGTATSGLPLGRSIVVDTDRFGTLKELLTSLGRIGYWDYRGVFVVRTAPLVTGAPAWRINAGENGVLTEMSRNLTRKGVKNIIIATGESADATAPVIGVVADLTPNSPTRYGGPFGPVPGRISSPLFSTNAQCVTAATAELRKSLGLPYQVSLGSIVNAALEPYDVVEVAYPVKSRSRTLVTEVHVLDDVVIPLDVSTAGSLATRVQIGDTLGEIA